MIHRTAAAAALALAALPARSHHGVASSSFAGAQGPGAALETTSALALPARTVFVLAKTEYARFRKLDFAEPENKDYSSFTTVGVGYGFRPSLSAFVFQPVSVKAQDGVGTSAGAADPSVLVALAFKWDEKLRLVPERESVDELEDWHFSAWVSSSLPFGSVERTDDRGERFRPDMQTGFGAPSPAAGVTALKQVSRRATVLAEASYQHFFPHSYAFTRYQFGGEARANGALVWRTHASPRARVDLVGELNGLHLSRDRERDASGALSPLEASGGTIVYAGGGVRASFGPLGVALGVRRAALRALNEGDVQQGSEGLESFRATATLTWAAGI